MALLMLPAQEAWRISGEALFTRVRGRGIVRTSPFGHSRKFVSLAENSSVSWQPPVELGERCGAHAVDQHRGAYDEATDHPRFLDTRLPKGEGRVVECRSPYRAEPSEEEHVLRSTSKRSDQRPQGQHLGSRLSTSTATTRSTPLQPSPSHPSHGSAIPKSTKIGRSKKREIASWISSWLSLALLEPAKLKTIPATKAAKTPLRWSSSVTPSTVRERARLIVSREVRSMVSFLSAHLSVLPAR